MFGVAVASLLLSSSDSFVVLVPAIVALFLFYSKSTFIYLDSKRRIELKRVLPLPIHTYLRHSIFGLKNPIALHIHSPSQQACTQTMYFPRPIALFAFLASLTTSVTAGSTCNKTPSSDTPSANTLAIYTPGQNQIVPVDRPFTITWDVCVPPIPLLLPLQLLSIPLRFSPHIN